MERMRFPHGIKGGEATENKIFFKISACNIILYCLKEKNIYRTSFLIDCVFSVNFFSFGLFRNLRTNVI